MNKQVREYIKQTHTIQFTSKFCYKIPFSNFNPKSVLYFTSFLAKYIIHKFIDHWTTKFSHKQGQHMLIIPLYRSTVSLGPYFSSKSFKSLDVSCNRRDLDTMWKGSMVPNKGIDLLYRILKGTVERRWYRMYFYVLFSYWGLC